MEEDWTRVRTPETGSIHEQWSGQKAVISYPAIDPVVTTARCTVTTRGRRLCPAQSLTRFLKTGLLLLLLPPPPPPPLPPLLLLLLLPLQLLLLLLLLLLQLLLLLLLLLLTETSHDHSCRSGKNLLHRRRGVGWGGEGVTGNEKQLHKSLFLLFFSFVLSSLSLSLSLFCKHIFGRANIRLY